MIEIADCGAGKAVLLLHALPYDSRQWSEQIAAVSQTHRVLGPDFPGFGRSPEPPGPLTFDALATDLLAQLRASGVDRAAVAGNSMGGYLAFAMFRAAPQFFRGFALVNSRAVADSDAMKEKRAALIARARAEGLGFLFEGAPSNAIPMLKDATVAGYVAAQQAIASRADASDLLAQIRVPASVIWGTDDAGTPLSEARALAAAMPDCVFEPVENAGHVPTLEQPEKITKALQRWIARCDRLS